MKPLKELFNNFTKSLLIHLRGEPEMDYTKFNEADQFEEGDDPSREILQVKDMPTSAEDLRAEELEDLIGLEKDFKLKMGLKKVEAAKHIQKINFDESRPGIPDTPAEKQKKEELIDHNEKQFGKLIYNYRRAVTEFGAYRGETAEADITDTKIERAESALTDASDAYIKKMHVRVLKENLENASHAAKIQILEDTMVRVTGNSNLRGLGRYILKGNPDILDIAEGLENPEDIEKALEENINKKGVILKAIAKMEEDLPNFHIGGHELNYFEELFKYPAKVNGARLTYKFGRPNREQAKQTLAERFDIKWKNGMKGKTDGIEYVVDAFSPSIVFHMPEEQTRWYNHLITVCVGTPGQKAELRSRTSIAKHRKAMQDKQIERGKEFKQLKASLNNVIWPGDPMPEDYDEDDPMPEKGLKKSRYRCKRNSYIFKSIHRIRQRKIQTSRKINSWNSKA